MRKHSLQIVLFFAIASTAVAQAQERLQMEGTEITGNKELPRVLYIVPWQSVERFEIESPQITSIMDQPLEPIERAPFKRNIHYHDAIFSKAKNK